MPDPRTQFLGGDVEGALSAYDLEVAAKPADASLLAGRAAVKLYRGDAGGCLEDAEKAIQLDPRCAEALLLRARLIEPKNRLEAIAQASRAIEADPGNAPAYYWRAIWRAGSGDEKGARKDLVAAASLEGSDLFRLQTRGHAHLALGDFREAAACFDRAIEAGVGLPFVYYARSQARSRLKDAAGAIADLTRVLESRPRDAGLFAERARERSRSGDVPGALEDLGRSIELDPDRPQPYYYRGVLSRSPQDFTRAVAMPASTADDHLFRGLVLELMDRRDEAGEAFARAREMAPLNHPRWPEIESKSRSVRPPPKETRQPQAQSGAPATIVIVALNIAVWVLQGDFSRQPDAETLHAHGALWRYSVWAGEYWRLFTAMFLHVGPIHLFMNMFFGYGWCAAVERLLGTPRFLVAYLLSGLGASAVSLLGHLALSAGASGALFGVLGMALSAFYVRLGGLQSFFDHPRVRNILWSMGIWFVIGMSLKVDNYAHFGGLIFGVLFGLLFMKASLFRPAKRTLSWIAVLTLLVGTTIAACVPRGEPEGRTRTLMIEGKFEEALEAVNELIRQDSMEPSNYVRRSEIHLKMREQAKAIEDLKKALEVAPPKWPDRAKVQGVLEELEKRKAPP